MPCCHSSFINCVCTSTDAWGVIDEGLVFQQQMAPLLVADLLGDAGEMGRREIEVEKTELFAHQPLGSVVIRHDAHLAGAAMAAGTIEALSLLAPCK
ncbi:hypothetical protein WH06_17650 [Aeromonas salmonicida subsp. salmonicida]|nr:hypothetical protein WH06_17650 [Aeromonas salmonicida subsp. salmonicida]